jgi:transketolase
LPCTELFAPAPHHYRVHVLPPAAAKVAIEAGATLGWWRYVGGRGDVIGLDRFGESAKAADLFRHFGFTVDHVVAVARRYL